MYMYMLSNVKYTARNAGRDAEDRLYIDCGEAELIQAFFIGLLPREYFYMAFQG